jgi:hypothetical protein
MYTVTYQLQFLPALATYNDVVEGIDHPGTEAYVSASRKHMAENVTLSK